MDRQFSIAALKLVIELAGKGIVLPRIAVANLAGFDHLVEDQLFQFAGHLRSLNLGVFDFLLNVLFFVS